MLIKRKPPPPPDGAYKIWLNSRVFAIIDADDYAWLIKYHWRLVRSQNCFYAARRFIRNDKTITIRMHREIMQTPPGLDCHHSNHNPLDNRKNNLVNLTPTEHRYRHGKM